MTIMPVAPRHIEAFHALLKAQGAQVALGWLNAGVPHRYSAIYCLNSDSFVNVYLHDKLGELAPPLLRIVPFESSFCQFVLRDGQFSTHDSLVDRRLDGHPYQGVVTSYHGVAIANDLGEISGSLCHFDMAGQYFPDSEHTLLQGAVRLLPRYLSPIRKIRIQADSLH